MTDHRIYTFLKLCELMNYRKTAEALNMTQPAVTQHIHFLEQEYGCRLFLYENRVLTKTPAAARLEKYAVSLLYNDKIFRENGYSTASFSRTSTISSFKLIEQAVSAGCGISFVYESIPSSSSDLASFRIQNSHIFHEFNYVYLKNTPIEKNLDQVISDYFPSLSQIPLSDPLV